MPQTLALIVAYVGGGTITAAMVVQAVIEIVVIAASYAYQQSQAAKMKRMLQGASALDNSRTLDIREPAASRKIIYGTIRAGGTLVYISTSGTGREYLHFIIAHAGHECSAIGNVYLNGELVPLDGSGNATGKYAGYVRVKFHLGSPTQTVDTDLQTDVGSTEWPNTSCLKGICYSYVRLKANQDLFPSGIPNYTALISGKLIYDPRSTLTAFSSNAALVLRDFLTDTTLGLGATSAEIDDAATITAANICDEVVNLNPSGTELRYALHGMVDSATPAGTTIGDLLSAMSGICPYAGGYFRMKAGAHTSSVQTLTMDDARAGISVATGDAINDAFNGVKGVYISDKNLWQPGDFPPVTNITTAGAFVVGQRYTILTVGTTTWTAIGAASNTAGVTFTATGAGSGTGTADQYLGEDGGLRTWKDINLPFTISSATAQRLAKIELERSRRDKTVIFKGKLTLLNIQVGDTVALTWARYGWATKLFEVTDFQFSVDDSNPAAPTLGIDLTLRETDSTAWSWSSSNEAVVASTPPVATYIDQTVVSAPAGLSLSTSNFQQTDGTIAPRLAVTITLPTDSYVLQGGYEHIEYKKSADTNWIIWSTTHNPNVVTEYITDVVSGTSYDVRVRLENVFGVRSAYSSGTYTPTNDTTAPATPTGLSALSGVASVVLAWADNTESDFDVYEVYRNTVNSFPGGTPLWVGTATSFIDTTGTAGTTYYYWLKAVDTSVNRSAATASVNATPTAYVSGGIVAQATAGSLSSFATSYTTGPSVTFTAVAGRTYTIDVSGDYWQNIDTPGLTLTAAIHKNGSLLRSVAVAFAAFDAKAPFSLSYADAPGAGSVTYDIRLKISAAGGANQGQIVNPLIVVS